MIARLGAVHLHGDRLHDDDVDAVGSELVGEGLARRALIIGQEHQQLQSSAVFGAAHQRIAYGALVEEFLAQLRVLAATGLEAGVPPMAQETDTSEEEPEEEEPVPAPVS